METRLLNIQHLYGIWTGLTPYRLRLDTLSEYPEPWSEKFQEVRVRGLANFSVLKKKESQAWG